MRYPTPCWPTECYRSCNPTIYLQFCVIFLNDRNATYYDKLKVLWLPFAALATIYFDWFNLVFKSEYYQIKSYLLLTNLFITKICFVYLSILLLHNEISAYVKLTFGGNIFYRFATFFVFQKMLFKNCTLKHHHVFAQPIIYTPGCNLIYIFHVFLNSPPSFRFQVKISV